MAATHQDQVPPRFLMRLEISRMLLEVDREVALWHLIGGALQADKATAKAEAPRRPSLNRVRVIGRGKQYLDLGNEHV